MTGLLRQLRPAPARRSGTAPAPDVQTGGAGGAEAVAAVDGYPDAAGEPPVEERVAPVARLGQLRAPSEEADAGTTAPGRRICCARCTWASTTGSPSGPRC